MPVVEKCLVCGLDLFWFPNDRPEKGLYFHQFKADASGSFDYLHNYKFIHLPVFALQLDLFEGRDVPAQVWSKQNGAISAK